MASKFVHLHTHSHYSFLQALPKIDELIATAKAQGMDALALTDAGNMHGAIEFYKAATAAGIKPILGVDAYLAPRSRFEKDRAQDAKRSRIVLLAETNEGYRNLLFLVTKSWTEGFFDRPRMDKELLSALPAGRQGAGKGIIALIPSFAGDIAQLLRSGDREGAAAALAEFKNIFPAENGSNRGARVFLEVTHHPKVEGHTKLMREIVKLAGETETPLVAQHDVYYLAPGDREACAIVRRIQQGERGRNEEEDFSFVSEEKMREFFEDLPEAVENAGAIAERTAVSLDLGTWVFPAIPVSAGFASYAAELEGKARAGLAERGLARSAEAQERLRYELSVINAKGFAPYFLIVADLLAFARGRGILTTTRGSVGGSLVAYATGVTNVDPLFYKLPFERFLNPERPKAPDIDMDIADNRRDEVIAYAREKYGEDRVAQIGTFGTMLARAAVRDVARALGHPYGVGDRIAKLIPIGSQGFPMTIDRALGLEKDLKNLYDEDEEAREVIDLAKRIEGSVRHVGVHAAGVVIAPTPLIEWTPLMPDPKGGKLITQYDMYAISDEYGGVGLLKFDFLGIKNLSILADSVAQVAKDRGIRIDIEHVALDDAATFAMLARGETEGLFQLAGSGMTRYLKELEPSSIYDINAMVALYRPGPMEVIPAYIERKHNPRLVSYLDPRMEKFLKESYGLLVYQDDLLYCAVELAGYSWLEVDQFRKAIGKKIPAEMAAQKEKFTKGIIAHGQTRTFAEKLWALFEPFQAYGFNKAHAATYGKLAYQTAYMKANHPVEYMAAVLSAAGGDVEEIARYVAEAKRMKIEVLPPDVNESGARFTAPGGGRTIRFGLSSIKNFGEGIAEAIIAERERRGAFRSIADFLARLGRENVNRKALEALIQCGALDSVAAGPGGRGTLLENIDTLLAFHRDIGGETAQASLFRGLAGAPTLTLPPGKPVSLPDRLRWEKELLGIYVSGHPLDAHAAIVAKARTTIGKLKAEPEPGRPVVLPVLLASARTVVTRGGEKMAFMKLEDATGTLEAVAFPRLYREHAGLIAGGGCFLVKGAVSIRSGEVSLALEGLKPL